MFILYDSQDKLSLSISSNIYFLGMKTFKLLSGKTEIDHTLAAHFHI